MTNSTKGRIKRFACLAAASDWSYGIPDALESASTASSRAIRVAPGATLRFKASEFSVTLRDVIESEGTIEFEEGARLKLAGDLKPGAGRWVSFATSASVSGVPALHENCAFRTVDNGDGTVTLQIRQRVGTAVVIR